jgi:DNA-binding NtrC family response regulator
MKEAARSFKIFLSFIKNTETMVRAISNQNKFANDMSLQLNVINEMIDALNNLKEDLEKIMEKYKKNIDIN